MRLRTNVAIAFRLEDSKRRFGNRNHAVVPGRKGIHELQPAAGEAKQSRCRDSWASPQRALTADWPKRCASSRDRVAVDRGSFDNRALSNGTRMLRYRH